MRTPQFLYFILVMADTKSRKIGIICAPMDLIPRIMRLTWLTSDEFRDKLNQLKSKTIFLFLDCCHAQVVATKESDGIGVDTPETAEQVKLTDADKLAEKFNDVSGLSYVSSCRADELSYILKGDSNSLFTKVLVEVFEDKHKKTFDNPYIRLAETLTYLFKEVPGRVPTPHTQ
ncbi:MAG: hypothetical protein ACI9FN_001358 [Saprospiraceae bacterium]|jgi:hypothetical protein